MAELVVFWSVLCAQFIVSTVVNADKAQEMREELEEMTRQHDKYLLLNKNLSNSIAGMDKYCSALISRLVSRKITIKGHLKDGLEKLGNLSLQIFSTNRRMVQLGSTFEGSQVRNTKLSLVISLLEKELELVKEAREQGDNAACATHYKSKVTGTIKSVAGKLDKAKQVVNEDLTSSKNLKSQLLQEEESCDFTVLNLQIVIHQLFENKISEEETVKNLQNIIEKGMEKINDLENKVRVLGERYLEYTFTKGVLNKELEEYLKDIDCYKIFIEEVKQ